AARLASDKVAHRKVRCARSNLATRMLEQDESGTDGANLPFPSAIRYHPAAPSHPYWIDHPGLDRRRRQARPCVPHDRRLAVPAKVFVAFVLLLPPLSRCPRTTSRVVDTARITAADAEPANWLTHGRTYSEQRYSPLRAIDTGSVNRLGLPWVLQKGENRGAQDTH